MNNKYIYDEYTLRRRSIQHTPSLVCNYENVL